MKTVDEILNQVEAEAFDGITSDSIKIRLRTMYERVLQSAKPEDIDAVVTDIVEYENESSLSTLKKLNKYLNLTVETTLSDYSRASMYFALNRAETGRKHPVAAYLIETFNSFVDENEQEIKALDELLLVSDILLDFNYASGNSDVMSLRVKNILF